ncbi:copper oxidase [Labedella gwakjiensis]|uniref:Copper oxidase n=1 Tax=Labedella gwakjiensis TaxID=390269 RepID=A0ABY0CCT9_9MICO|nr:copper oxidase [Labedella gwakjiensis]
MRISRRTLLLGAGGLAVIGVGGYWLTEGRSSGGGTSFTTPLRIPPLAESEVVDGERVFRLAARAGETELVPGVQFATMGFNGVHLGPTIRAARGERVRMHVTNELDVPTTAHWHGMILPATEDGTPHQSIAPAATWTAAWQIDQPAATLWYHPHPHGQTELQVGRGMAGLFLVDDDDESPDLPSEYGVDDIPLIIQDIAVRPGGESAGTPTASPIGRIGNTPIVNGTYRPHLRASSGLVRLRILNASAARCYNLELSTGEPLLLVGTDGGLLPSPQSVQRVFLSPAERAEVLVQLPPGSDLVLRSVPHDLGMSSGDDTASGADNTLDILRITTPSDTTAREVPTTLPSAVLPALADAMTERRFMLGNTTINGRVMDMDRIDTTIVAGATERWTIMNTSDRAHNFHIHGAQFAVHRVNGEKPAAQNRGWKDTVFLARDDAMELIVPFSSYVDPATPYMYHCHLLWHEDQGMMAQYVLTTDGGDDGADAGTDMGMDGMGMGMDHPGHD